MSFEKTLTEIKKVLDSQNVVWGVGGSYLLKLFNLSSSVNDLDLWVQPQDMSKVKDIFKNYEEKETDIKLPKNFYFKMNYHETEVDFISCFIIKPNQNTFEYEIAAENITYQSFNELNNIPITSLEDWYIIYKLLKRNEKAEKIEKFFLENEFDIETLKANYSNYNLPNYIKKDAKKMINNFLVSLQLPLWEEGTWWDD